MYILNDWKLSVGLLSKVTIFRRDSPNCILPADTAGMPEMPRHLPESIKKGKKTKELTNCTRKLVIVASVKMGFPAIGVFQKISQMVGVHRSTIMQMWKNYRMDASQAINIPAVKFSCWGERGMPHVFFPGKSLMDHIKSIPVSQHRTATNLAATLWNQQRYHSLPYHGWQIPLKTQFSVETFTYIRVCNYVSFVLFFL